MNWIIRPKLICRWRSEFENYQGTSFPGSGKAKLTKEESEVSSLKKELAEARMERDILKKQFTSFPRALGDLPVHKKSHKYVSY
ncbi:hypothetical protein [Labilibaculum antarcticum]|uniref:Transposase n=1 Tax=Labilibaculum antarcticum TaxID=1717717 RepID=A0A1Y1CG95_9BACT|nr:hypothetical protein [Labilibaculum antarcticum]BAX79310.1 transposase [Labilibaculum antarcticum]